MYYGIIWSVMKLLIGKIKQIDKIHKIKIKGRFGKSVTGAKSLKQNIPDAQKVKKIAEKMDRINARKLKVKKAETRPTKTLNEWLEDSPDLLNETRQWYNEKPEWWGINPDKTPVFYRPKAEVDAIRKLPGESGGHHPHGLGLGGPKGQTLTPTGETARTKNPTHSQVTGLQKRVINRIKGQTE